MRSTASPAAPAAVACCSQPQRLEAAHSGADSRRLAFEWLCQLAQSRFCSLDSHEALLRPEQFLRGASLGAGAYALVHSCQVAAGCVPGLEGTRGASAAVKQLKRRVAADRVELQCFLLEAHILAQLRHPCAPVARQPLNVSVVDSLNAC